MEAIFLLLEQKILPWNKIQTEMNNGNFIVNVLQMDPKKIKNKTIKDIDEVYMKDENWDIEKIKGASKAISPFVDWLIYELIYIKL